MPFGLNRETGGVQVRVLPRASPTRRTAGGFEENAQLRQAVRPHAATDQAAGVLIAVRQLSPGAGRTVLRQVSPRLNTKPHVIAEKAIGRARARPMRRHVLLEPDVRRSAGGPRKRGGRRGDRGVAPGHDRWGVLRKRAGRRHERPVTVFAAPGSVRVPVEPLSARTVFAFFALIVPPR